MSTDLESLYQQVILDHARKRSGFGLSDDAVARHHELNPTCGDEITVGIAVDADGAKANEAIVVSALRSLKKS